MSTVPQLSRYQVLGRLATGGMAEVWLARSVGVGGFEKLVVVKTILKNLAENQQFVQMFVHEARVAAMLNHPNCVQIFDLGQEGSTLYIAMEYIDGFSLSRVLNRAKEKRARPPVEIVTRIFMDAATGLDYAHRLTDREGRKLNLVHRDVSPDNLIIAFSGQTKLVDFGVAKAATPSVMAQTRFGVVKGKFGYIAPEYLRGEKIDGRADVFALGVSLYRALTGKRPFGGANEAAMTMAVLKDTPVVPTVHFPALSPALSEVVMMALQKDPAVRFESARAMRQAMEAAVKPAEHEAVGDYLNQLWPPGDPERVAMESLARGVSEETSSPALASIISGTFGGVSRAQSTPHPFGMVAEETKAIQAPPEASIPVELGGMSEPGEPAPVEPAAAPPAPPVAAAVKAPVAPVEDLDDEPARRSRAGWVVLVLAVLAAGAYAFYRHQAKVLPAPAPVVEQPNAPAPVAAPATPAVPAAPAAPAATTAHLKFATEPPVTVSEEDGEKKQLGTSPFELDLPPGHHALRLVNKAAGVDQTLELELKAGDATEVKELAKGTLSVKADPWAYVKLDGKMLGETPVVRQVFEGTHLVELNNTQNMEHRRLEVKVKGGETKYVKVNLDESE